MLLQDLLKSFASKLMNISQNSIKDLNEKLIIIKLVSGKTCKRLLNIP